jgi:hypothetical protein
MKITRTNINVYTNIYMYVYIHNIYIYVFRHIIVEMTGEEPTVFPLSLLLSLLALLVQKYKY